MIAIDISSMNLIGGSLLLTGWVHKCLDAALIIVRKLMWPSLLLVIEFLGGTLNLSMSVRFNGPDIKGNPYEMLEME